jgi:hypothetical protein
MNRPRFGLAAVAFVSVLGSAPPVLAGAEDLRAQVAGIAVIEPDNADGTRLAMAYNESIAVLMPRYSDFVQGFEIEIRSPPAVIASPGGFAYELWCRIDPIPDRGRLAYTGERIMMQPLPARAGYAIQIPVRADHSIKPSPYATLLPALVEQRDFPFLFRLIPIAKGLGSEAEASRFQLRIRPLLSDEGALALRLRYPEGVPERYPLTVTVDDRRVEPSAPILLGTGTHRLALSSEAYKDESLSFAIEQGRTLDLVVELQDTTPILVIEAPDSAIFSLDGSRVDHVEHPTLRVEPGEHSASCRIGDYTLTRKFTAYRGKTYKLVLEIDLQVQEGQE